MIFNSFERIIHTPKMGIIYSYFSGDEHEQHERLQALEKIETMARQIEKLETTVQELKNNQAEQQLLFEWDHGIILRDSNKIENIQTGNEISPELNKELEGFEETESFMKAKGFNTQEELNSYVDEHKIYTFEIRHNGKHYQKLYTQKADADAFRYRLSDWTKTRFY